MNLLWIETLVFLDDGPIQDDAFGFGVENEFVAGFHFGGVDDLAVVFVGDVDGSFFGGGEGEAGAALGDEDGVGGDARAVGGAAGDRQDQDQCKAEVGSFEVHCVKPAMVC